MCLQKAGIYTGKKFNAICHFFGYQARGSLPSNFDCNYAYVLGQTAYYLTEAGLNGYLATVSNLKHPVDKWHCGGAPITVCLIVFSHHLIFSYFQLSEHYCSRLSSVTKLRENPDQETSAHTYILSNCCMAKELDTHG
jgi:hypothetical protein